VDPGGKIKESGRKASKIIPGLSRSRKSMTTRAYNPCERMNFRGKLSLSLTIAHISL